MAKKNNYNYRKTDKNSKKRKIEVVDSPNIWHIITVSGCIIIFLCFFYFVTLYLTRNERDKNDNNTDTSSTSIFSQTETIVGNITS